MAMETNAAVVDLVTETTPSATSNPDSVQTATPIAASDEVTAIDNPVVQTPTAAPVIASDEVIVIDNDDSGVVNDAAIVETLTTASIIDSNEIITDSSNKFTNTSVINTISDNLSGIKVPLEDSICGMNKITVGVQLDKADILMGGGKDYSWIDKIFEPFGLNLGNFSKINIQIQFEFMNDYGSQGISSKIESTNQDRNPTLVGCESSQQYQQNCCHHW